MAKVGGYVRTDFKLAGDFDLWSLLLHTELYGNNFRWTANNQIRDRQIHQYVIEAKESLFEIENY